VTDSQARTLLPIRRLGIDTYEEPVIFMHANCHVCRSEGFEAHSRVRIALGSRSVIATLNVVHSSLLTPQEAGLSEAAWKAIGAHAGDSVLVTHPDPIESFSAVRAKIYGRAFTEPELHAIVHDVTAGHYSGLEMAAFITACAGEGMSAAETISLTRAMIAAGSRLTWPQAPVVDKHSVGGLPGNCTTPIVVGIVAASGLTIPKTSSRAITSPAGTADTMEMLAPVDLTLEHMRRVVESEGGCVVWGGAMALSPADDILIRVERPLDFDSVGQLAASVISKKVAAGSTHLVIDMPVGATAKVRTPEAARSVGSRLMEVANAMRLAARVVETDGTQPVGRGIGPALEARDVLAVLQNDPEAPADLRERAVVLAGALLEIGGCAASGEGARMATDTLGKGKAWSKFQAICEAQGELREPPRADYQRPYLAADSGRVSAFDNRRLAKTAKLAGAPTAPAAGLDLHVRVGDQVERGQPLFTLHAETPGELDYATAYVEANPRLVTIGIHE
jgi:thymidine phosphorylase